MKFHQVSSKSDEKQKSFINSPFFCSEFQSVSRIVKIGHSAGMGTKRLTGAGWVSVIGLSSYPGMDGWTGL